MIPRTKYRLGTAILVVAVLVILVELLGLTGVIPKYGLTRSLNTIAIIFIILGAVIRRRAREDMRNVPPA